MHVAAGSVRAVFGNEAVMLKLAIVACLPCRACFDNREGKREALIYIVIGSLGDAALATFVLYNLLVSGIHIPRR